MCYVRVIQLPFVPHPVISVSVPKCVYMYHFRQFNASLVYNKRDYSAWVVRFILITFMKQPEVWKLVGIQPCIRKSVNVLIRLRL